MDNDTMILYEIANHLTTIDGDIIEYIKDDIDYDCEYNLFEEIEISQLMRMKKKKTWFVHLETHIDINTLFPLSSINDIDHACDKAKKMAKESIILELKKWDKTQYEELAYFGCTFDANVSTETSHAIDLHFSFHYCKK